MWSFGFLWRVLFDTDYDFSCMGGRLVHLLWNVECHVEIWIISCHPFLQPETCNMRFCTIAIPALFDRRVNTASMAPYAFEYSPPRGVFSSCFHAVEFIVRVE